MLVPPVLHLLLPLPAATDRLAPLLPWPPNAPLCSLSDAMALALASAVHSLADWRCNGETVGHAHLRCHEAFLAAVRLAMFTPHATDMLLLHLPGHTLTRSIVSLLQQLLVSCAGRPKYHCILRISSSGPLGSNSCRINTQVMLTCCVLCLSAWLCLSVCRR